MAGGRFDKSVGKVRPGTYVNVESTRQEPVKVGTRGTVLLPLASTDYGPAKEFITLNASAPDAARAKLGYSIYENDAKGNTLLIREAFKKASTVILYICTENTAAATATGGGLTATAKFKGTRGNKLTYTIIADPVEGFDVEIHLDGTKVEAFEDVKTAADLAGSEYITFTATEGASLEATAAVQLAKGADAEKASNADITAFLDQVEGIRWNTMAFPFADTELHTALKTKLVHLREGVGRTVQAVAPNFAADYEGIINVSNGYKIGDKTVDAVKATAFVAGATAAATNVQSNTYLVVDGATAVEGAKDHEAAVAAIKAGELFFSTSEAGGVIIEYDINSLVTIPNGKDTSYRKNRVIRVFDSVVEAIQLNFPPNKFDNDPDSWDIMEGLGKSILKQFGPKPAGVGAIKNIDYAADFIVDRENSIDDATYLTVGIQAVDSAEKFYVTVKTR